MIVASAIGTWSSERPHEIISLLKEGVCKWSPLHKIINKLSIVENAFGIPTLVNSITKTISHIFKENEKSISKITKFRNIASDFAYIGDGASKTISFFKHMKIQRVINLSTGFGVWCVLIFTCNDIITNVYKFCFKKQQQNTDSLSKKIISKNGFNFGNNIITLVMCTLGLVGILLSQYTFFIAVVQVILTLSEYAFAEQKKQEHDRLKLIKKERLK